MKNFYIELSNVSKKIGHNIVLNNINIRMESGTIYGLKGKNGAGKTMLMRAICGLIITDGMVNVNGEIIGKDISFPRSIGVLIENPAFINGYTGIKNLKSLALIQNIIGDEQIIDSMHCVGLNPYDKRVYGKYSLGMKQKLGIAAAIMESPDIIILDEPFNALDTAGVSQVKDLICQHKERGAIIIISSHDAEELESLSDVVAEMRDGTIINIKQKYNY